MNLHEQMQERISLLLDGALSVDEEKALRAHLAECPDCAAVYEAFSALSDSLGGELEEPPASLHENVMANLRRQETRRRNVRGREWIGFAAVAAVLALALLAGPVLRRNDLGRSAETNVQTAAGMVGKTFGVTGEKSASEYAPADAAMPYMAAEAESADYALYEEAPASNGPVVMTTEAAAAAAAGEDIEAERAVSWEDAGEAAAEPVSMNELLLLLGGRETELDLDTLGLSPALLVDTNGGVLALYRYAGSLYYRDPFSGTTWEASCSEAALLDFLEG